MSSKKSFATFFVVTMLVAAVIAGGAYLVVRQQTSETAERLVEDHPTGARGETRRKNYQEPLYDSHAHPSSILEERGEDFVALMQSEGVKGSVITPWINPAKEQEKVKKAKKLIAPYSDLFALFFLLTNEEDKLVATRDDLSRLHEQNGDVLHGWGEFALWGPAGEEDILDPSWKAIYQYAQEHNLIVMMHPTEQHEEEVFAIIKAYPDLTLLLHGDESFYYLPSILNASKNVYFTLDTTYLLRNNGDPALPLFDAESAEEFIEIFDDKKNQMMEAAAEEWLPVIEAHPDRILWGTDIQHPWHGDPRVYKRLTDFSREFISLLPREIQEKYAYKNAERLFSQKHIAAEPAAREENTPPAEESPHAQDFATDGETANKKQQSSGNTVSVARVYENSKLIAEGELIFTYDLKDTVFGEQPCKRVYAVFDPAGFSSNWATDESLDFICGTEEGISVEIQSMEVEKTFAEFRKEHSLDFERLPMEGVWYVTQGHEEELGGYTTTHSQEGGAGEFAWDFTQLAADAKGGYLVEEHEGGHEEFRKPNNFACDLDEWEDERCICQDDPNVNTGGASNTDYYAFGKLILAPSSGTVVLVEDSNEDICPFGEFGDGNELVLRLVGGYSLWFHHLKQGSVPVKEGDTVRAGEKIGEVGNSGFTLGPHLHASLIWSGSFGEHEVEAPFSPGWSIPAVFEQIYVKPANAEKPLSTKQTEYDPASWDFLSNNAFIQPR